MNDWNSEPSDAVIKERERVICLLIRLRARDQLSFDDRGFGRPTRRPVSKSGSERFEGT